MQNTQNGVVLIKAPFGLWINLFGLGGGRLRPLTGPQCNPQPAATSMKGSGYLPCWPFFPHRQTPSQPFAGFQGLSGSLPSSPNLPPPAPTRHILLSILPDNKDTRGIYLYLQTANETIQWKAAPACWSLPGPLMAFSVFQFPSIYSTYKFSTVNRHHSSEKPICSLGHFISISCFAFYYYC